jgi:hypothetical protein
MESDTKKGTRTLAPVHLLINGTATVSAAAVTA